MIPQPIHCSQCFFKKSKWYYQSQHCLAHPNLEQIINCKLTNGPARSFQSCLKSIHNPSTNNMRMYLCFLTFDNSAPRSSSKPGRLGKTQLFYHRCHSLPQFHFSWNQKSMSIYSLNHTVYVLTYVNSQQIYHLSLLWVYIFLLQS